MELHEEQGVDEVDQEEEVDRGVEEGVSNGVIRGLCLYGRLENVASRHGQAVCKSRGPLFGRMAKEVKDVSSSKRSRDRSPFSLTLTRDTFSFYDIYTDNH